MDLLYEKSGRENRSNPEAHPNRSAACKASSSAHAQKHCHLLRCEAGRAGNARLVGTGQLRDVSFGQ